MKRFLHTKEKFLVLIFLLGSLFAFAADPTGSASNVQFPVANIDGAQFTVTFTAGNGTGGRIVVVKEGSEITGIPADGTKYNSNSAFATAGTEFTAPGEYVVAHTTSTLATITVTKLKPGTTYYVAIFELNGSYATPATIDYSTVTPTDKKVTTVSAPTSQATITGFTQVTGNSLKINWTNGNGKGRLVVAKKGNSLIAIPQDLKSYAASSAFAVYTSSDYVLDAETFAVYKTGTQTSADITSLEPNTVYTFAIYEFNGNQSPVYLTTTVTQSITTSAGPTIGTGAIGIGSLQGNSIEISCSRGNGAKRIIIAKKGSAVTSIPVNGTNYMANSIFGTPAAEIVPGSGEYVVYTGTSNGVTITNLELFTTYHFAIYEFDQDANGYTYYLTGPQSSTLPSRKKPEYVTASYSQHNAYCFEHYRKLRKVDLCISCFWLWNLPDVSYQGRNADRFSS